MSAPATDLYGDFTVGRAAELIDDRIREERAVLTAAREAVAAAYRKLTISGLVSGDSTPNLAELRREAFTLRRMVGELEQMRIALSRRDPVAELRAFAAETPNQLLAADAAAMALALLRTH
ncbi:hypothetical protein ACT17_32725 [Mycolicibacterium conceptionense]|uniref:Uncharacterized protein n=1 Tax=Mycolicibacterium conceptionense TaxID=451644 RepID=A0A0J8TXQ2_9MYCO|nr:hypothetical protein [Mycolicibacterium conceptionense]KMV13947.1 hypothetical protein ACT17_32725 [Mycolicibacterium conceptionense]